jgi:hypothetical protein
MKKYAIINLELDEFHINYFHFYVVYSIAEKIKQINKFAKKKKNIKKPVWNF